MSKSKILLFAGVAILVLPLLAACGGSNKVDVTLTDAYHIELASASASAGEITFHITNEASDVVHEFVVIKTDIAADSLPVDDEGNVDESAFEPIDEVEDLDPAATEDLTVNLEPGHYVLLCNLPEHYGKGMHADFTVNP